MPKILVVDDEEDMRTTLAILLEAEGYSVVTAMNGHGAVERITQEPIDLVVSDIRMPDMDGIELLREVKTRNPLLPVVMVTGYGSAELAVESMKLGAFDYLQKPFDNERLYEVVRSALSQASLQRSAVKGGLVEQRLSEKLSPRPTGPASPPSPVHPGNSHHAIRAPAWRWSWTAAIVALVVFGAGGWIAWQHVHWGIRSFTVGTTHPSGLSAEEDEVWLCDWLAQGIFQFKVATAVGQPASLIPAGIFKFTGRQLTGVARGPNQIFTCDAMTKKIYEHESNAELTVRAEAASPGPSPSGLFWDGKYLWSVDAQARKIYKHHRDANFTLLKTFEAPGPHPVGLGTDGETIWSADAETKLIYQHQSGDTFTVIGTYRLPRGTPERLSAFTRSKTLIWIGSEGSNNLLAIQPSALIPVK